MYDDYQGLSEPLMLALRTNQRLTVDQFYELLDFAQAIIDYGHRNRAFEKWPSSPPSDIIVGIPELECRFREAPEIVKEALLLLKDMDRASPITSRIWRLKLTEISSSRRENAATAP
jgi:hypothetical protein